ncbi:MAG TPA: DHCW motif cupin fold protein [Cyclobacteriaceae bacterium]|nr:DHCW motif cupin fold protein [Cyclobacteriaceae bacterium]
MESILQPIKNLVPFQTTDWNALMTTEHVGECGKSHWRTMQWGDLRVRVVEYSPGYKANHWCTKGHILFCLEGELTTELKDGRQFVLKQGMSYQVSDDVSAHRSSTKTGAKLFIVDGGFLKIEKNKVQRGVWM